MSIIIYFDNGASCEFDDIENMMLKTIPPTNITLVMFNGLTVRLNHEERFLDHRMRTHSLADGTVKARYYILLTNQRKVFFFSDGTFVSMPEGGEKDAWWRTFTRLPKTDLEMYGADPEEWSKADMGL